jgi:hypothetical protein
MSYPHLPSECAEHHGLVRDFGGSTDRMARPTITVLCGSTRFADEFRAQNLRLTLAGEIVLSIGCDTKSDADLAAAGVEFTPELKERLDALHKRKIDLADQVFVINFGGYVGESTRSEIAYAESIGRPVTYLEHVPGWPSWAADDMEPVEVTR